MTAWKLAQTIILKKIPMTYFLLPVTDSIRSCKIITYYLQLYLVPSIKVVFIRVDRFKGQSLNREAWGAKVNLFS